MFSVPLGSLMQNPLRRLPAGIPAPGKLAPTFQEACADLRAGLHQSWAGKSINFSMLGFRWEDLHVRIWAVPIDALHPRSLRDRRAPPHSARNYRTTRVEIRATCATAHGRVGKSWERNNFAGYPGILVVHRGIIAVRLLRDRQFTRCPCPSRQNSAACSCPHSTCYRLTAALAERKMHGLVALLTEVLGYMISNR